VPDEGCGLGKKRGGDARLGTLWPASSAHPRCCGRATCVPDPGHCEQLAGRQGRSSARGCGASSQGGRGSPADRITEWKKNFCRVTTRRRNLWVFNSLRRGLRSLAALFLSLGVPGFDVGVLAMSGLPPRRLPAVDLPPAFRILAVALVPTPRLILAPTTFAQAIPRARSAPSGRAAVLSRTLTSAHGRCFLPREKLGESVSAFSSSAIKTRTKRLLASLSPSGEQDQERDGFRNAIQKETPGSTTALVALSKRSRLALFSRLVSPATHQPRITQIHHALRPP
jgi:hypothetical protein